MPGDTVTIPPAGAIVEPGTGPPSEAIRSAGLISGGDMSGPTRSGSDSSSRISPSSDGRSGDSTKFWRTPRTVKQFAAQVNDVATRLLNGEIELETARSYASLARTVAQAASLETSRSRFLKEAPDLRLDDEA